MPDRYTSNKSPRELYQTLLIGLKKHLTIAQDTTAKKDTRLTSLNNMSEVIEYVLNDINPAVPEEERAIMVRFFTLLLVKTRSAAVSIHSQPETFTEEINFINILLKI